MSTCESHVKAVTFDLWETLLLEKNGWNRRRRKARCRSLTRVLKKFGIRISVDQIESAIAELFPWLGSIWHSNNEVSHLDQIQFILKKASEGSVSMKQEWIEDLTSAYISAIFEVPPYLNQDAGRVLKWLRDHNKLIGLICNVGLTPGFGLRRFLAREGVANYFDEMLFSDEVGIRKPDVKIFRLAAQKLNVKPYEIVHIGDNLKSDILGAKRAGFRTIFLLTEVGRDRIAESDPTSLVSISRSLYDLNEEPITPDRIITSLGMTIKATTELEA